jgi:hypothetical protein
VTWIIYIRQTFPEECNDSASRSFTANLIANILTKESAGQFDARVGIQGHFQQGKQTSPLAFGLFELLCGAYSI